MHSAMGRREDSVITLQAPLPVPKPQVVLFSSTPAPAPELCEESTLPLVQVTAEDKDQRGGHSMEKNVKEDNDYYLHLQGDMYEGRNKVKSIRSIKGGDKRQRGDRRGHDLGSTFQDDAQTPRLGYTETEPMASFRGPSAKRRGLATYPSHTRPTLTANAFPSGIDPQWWRGLSRAEMKAGPGATRKEIDAADKKIKYREKRRKQGTTLWGNVEDNLREALYRQRNGMRMCGTREYLVSEDITPKTSEGEDTEDQRRIDCQGVALGVLRRPKLQRRLSMLDVARVSNNAGRDVHTELQSNG